MMKKTKVTIGVAVAVLTLAGIGTGVAVADGGSTSGSIGPSATTAPPPSGSTHAQGKHRALLARVEHGEFTVGGKRGRVADVQRGQVQSVNASSITVKSTDGFTATYTVNSTTKVRKAKQAVGIGQVATGDRVVVIADKNGSTDIATRIIDP